MHDVNARLKFTREPEQKRDRFVLGFVRARREPRCVTLRGCAFWQLARLLLRSGQAARRARATERGGPLIRGAPRADRPRSPRRTRRHRSGTRKHLNPNTPASHSGASSAIFPGTTPPQKPMSTESFPAAAASFSRNTRHGRRRRNAVERHLDQRGDAARRRRARGRRKTFPLGAAGLVDVDVRVDQAGHHDGVARFVHRITASDFIECGDGDDCAAADVNRRRALAFGRDDAASADDQIGRCGGAGRGRIGAIRHRVYGDNVSMNSSSRFCATRRR